MRLAAQRIGGDRVEQRARRRPTRQHRSERDRRSVKLKLTQKGLDLCSRLSEMETRHGESLLKLDGGNESDKGRDLLRALERVWSDYIQYGAH